MKFFDVYPLYNLEIVRAQGSTVWDADGQEYLDMYGGHAVISIGHTHPHYVKTLTEQLNKIGFYSNSVHIGAQKVLAEKFGRVSGMNDYQLFMCNSGAEANENALKLASFVNGKKTVIAFKGAFHGRTSLAVACTDNPAIVAPVNETQNVVFLPHNDEAALEEAFKKYDVSSVILETIQGVGGIIVASDSFLRKVRLLCDANNAIFISDSVQDGCGRTGTYYAPSHAGVKADIYTMAKGIGNGFPVGAIAIEPGIASKYGMLGTTFGGNHLACAAMIAVCDIIEKDNLIDNAAKMGDFLMSEISKFNGVKEVRGRGLMVGVELEGESAEFRKRLLFDEHIFVGSSSNKNVFRLLPALNISKSDCERALESISRCL